MIRTLLTTTAIAVLMSAGAHAQTETTPAAPAAPADAMAPADPAAPAAPADSMAPAAPADAMTPAPADSMTTAPADGMSMTADRTPWEFSAGYTIGADDFIVNDLLGAPVYSSAGDDAEEIGTVNDLVITADGDINAVVIGVGGFLGIGEKNVAVDYLSLEHVMAADNTWRWVLPTTAEALESAPDFVWEDPRAPADNMMAPADGMAPADPAMAPAAPAQ